MANGYVVNTLDATINTNIGTPTNTGGTATLSAILGDFANSPLASRVPVKLTKSITLNVNNTTGSITVATLTGAVRVLAIVGVVTTVLSSNVTAAHLRLNDSTNTPAITLAAGTALSAATVGSLISKTGLATAALVLSDSSQCRVIENATQGLLPDDGFDLVAKSGATTTIEFRYTTTNAPSSGVIAFDILYYPVGSGSLA